MKDITNIKTEIDIQSKHPHVRTQAKRNGKTHATTHLENELYYVKHGKYPDPSMEFKIPEDIAEKAMDVEEKLNR